MKHASCVCTCKSIIPLNEQIPGIHFFLFVGRHYTYICASNLKWFVVADFNFLPITFRRPQPSPAAPPSARDRMAMLDLRFGRGIVARVNETEGNMEFFCCFSCLETEPEMYVRTNY